MEKKALLTYGYPRVDKKENSEQFIESCKINLKLISEVLKKENYNFEIVPFSKNVFDEYIFCKNMDFLFYYDGHASGRFGYICDFSKTLNSLFEDLNKIGKERIIILDSCTGEYLKNKRKIKNSTIIGAEIVPYSKSLSKLIHEAVIYRGKDLKDINQNTFNEMNHNWVYCNK